MWLSAFWSVLKVFLSILKIPFYAVSIVIVLFIIICGIWFIYYTCKGKRLKRGSRTLVKRDGFLKKLFFKLPQRIVLDTFERDPDFFKYQGLIIFEGIQGTGKSIGMIEFAARMQEEYPKAVCTSNYGYVNEDTVLEDWRMLMSYTNDIYGVIVLMDELQNWFSSNDSRNFPPEMLSVITQNRKNRRIILGTAQNFYLLAKAIRSQTTEVRRCTTLFGALTLVRRFRPVLDSDGNVKEFKRLGFYFFVHDEKLRNSYDTYRVIQRLVNVGFQDAANVKIEENNYYNLINMKGKK